MMNDVSLVRRVVVRYLSLNDVEHDHAFAEGRVLDTADLARLIDRLRAAPVVVCIAPNPSAGLRCESPVPKSVDTGTANRLSNTA